MTVKELIEKLQEFDPELAVCSDSELGSDVVTSVVLQHGPFYLREVENGGNYVLLEGD